MLRDLFVVVLLMLAAAAAHGQGTVRGKITDSRGETLPGATVVVKSDPTVGTVTDLDGNYSLRLSTPGPTVLVISFVGLEPQEFTANPRNNEVVVANFILTDKKIELGEFQVEAKANRSGDAYLDRLKLNSANNLNFISREIMFKSGDGDAAAAVRRVTGVSTVGPFVSVRGLADRYVVTTVNGSRIPTLDPFTNNLRLDLFPTGLLDNIIITKTATPDLPGDWAGAFLSMNTSDYPTSLQVTVATTIGFNPNSSWKTIVGEGQRSSTDWLGFDDGQRGVPEGVPGTVDEFPGFVEPSVYQQLGLLGLGGYLNNYGITANTPGFGNTVMSNNNTLQHLALTELGMLPPALLNNASAVGAAVNNYNSTYNLSYFSPIVNADLARYNTSFDNSSWRVGSTTGNPNYNAGFIIGNQVDVFKKKGKPKQIGFLVGMRYNAETQNDGASTILRTFEMYDDETPADNYNRKGTQRISQVSNGWSSLGSLSFKLDRNNSFSLVGMATGMGQSNARSLTFLDPTVNSSTFVSEDQFYEQRKLWTVQYGSRHLIPAFNLTVNADVSYSKGERDMLDFKTVQYIADDEGNPVDVDGALLPPGRIYRFLDQSLLDARLSFELPLNDDRSRLSKVKFGGDYRRDERTNDQLYFNVLGAPGPDQWQEPGRFEMRPDGRFTSRYAAFGTFKDNDIGILNVWSLYGMLDVALSTRFRAVGGLRAEHSDMITDVRRFFDDGLAPDDPNRGTVGDVGVGGGGGAEPKPAVPGLLDQWDLLPSINTIYKLRESEETPMNLRVGYFRSLGRPSFREFSVVQYYDYLLWAPVYGNPNLKMTTGDNYDLRVEQYFRSGNNLSASVFYKSFQNHIELLRTAQGGFTWRNANSSVVYGVELEGKVNLTRGLDARGNLTLMHSESELTTVLNGEEVRYTTEMFGQAPYIVNAMLDYSLDSNRTTITVSYNVQGPKLAVTNSELDPTGIRAYEMPRHMIDITASQKFGKHWRVALRVRDVLNTPFRRSYKFASGYDADFDRYRWGTEYMLTLIYTIR
ncbi:MAG: TonB-dependent receptor [Flavobacteriales bacterium]|nr:TonB-dependent receptor [Flavobacteriales bacterium]